MPLHNNIQKKKKKKKKRMSREYNKTEGKGKKRKAHKNILF